MDHGTKEEVPAVYLNNRMQSKARLTKLFFFLRYQLARFTRANGISILKSHMQIFWDGLWQLRL